jgi:hypothetical protein
MQAFLVRVAVDQTYGVWNGPMNPDTNEFVFVPIPEKRPMSAGLATPYTLIEGALARFEASNPDAPLHHVRLPQTLTAALMHLDPDFEQLTYGDSGTRRGRGLTGLQPDDLVVFYSGLKPVAPCPHRQLVYALVGLYRIAEAVRVDSVPASRWCENAHTRCVERETSDVIVRAKPGSSGRLKQCIPIGEFRDRAYRVRRDVLEEWGGLSCHDGYLQRSAVLPTFLEPRRFLSWFERQRPEMISANNP